jgi:hypothetical protein
MYATKRRLKVLHRKDQLAARTDLPRSKYGKPVYGARKARFAKLEAERAKASEKQVEAKADGA